MDPLTIGAIIGGVQGAGQLISGAIQKGKAKKMARKNPRPKYAIQSPILDNQALVESMAGEGLSDAAKQVYSTGAERGLSSSIDAILKGGGSVNNISDIYDSFQNGIGKLALIDEEMRAKNINNLITQNNTLAAEKDKEWQVNVFAPYADKAQAAAALSKQGSDNIWKGINTIGGTATNFLMGKEYKKEGDDVFKKPDASTSTTTTGPVNGVGSSFSASGILSPMPRQSNSGGLGGLDPIMIDGVLYDPITMQPIN